MHTLLRILVHGCSFTGSMQKASILEYDAMNTLESDWLRIRISEAAKLPLSVVLKSPSCPRYETGNLGHRLSEEDATSGTVAYLNPNYPILLGLNTGTYPR